jgi:hypothetical protein
MDRLEKDEWRPMNLEAERRGFPNAKALKQWCERRGVPYRRDGGLNWIRGADIDHAITQLPIRVVRERPAPPEGDSVLAEWTKKVR